MSIIHDSKYAKNTFYAKKSKCTRNMTPFLNDAINLLSKSESVKFSLIESVICLLTDPSVKKYFSLLN